jgi:serine O-acetyltransferase
MKASLRISVTLLSCALLLIFVADIGAVLETLGRCDPLWAGIAILAFLLDRVLMSYKWGLLLATRGYTVSLLQKLMVYCSAMMWGLALPSTVGADGIRVMLVRRFGVRVDDTLATILVERGIGFIVALLTAVGSLVVLRSMLPPDAVYDHALALGLAGLLCALLILVFSFTSHALRSVLVLIPQRFSESKAVRMLEQLHDAYVSLACDRRRIATFSILTMTEHILMVACYALVARALEVQFNPIFVFAAVPLALLVSRLPVSLDGIGVYEGIFIAIMALGGVRPADALAVSLAARALQVIVWLPWWLALAARTDIRPPAAQVTQTADSHRESHMIAKNSELPVQRRSHGESALVADLRRRYSMTSGSTLRRVLTCVRAPGVHAVVVLRFGQWSLRRNRALRIVFDPLYVFMDFFIKVLWGIEIPRTAQIGPGLYIGHCGGITVSSRASIGRDCNLSQNITIGVSGAGEKRGAPTLGDNVYVAPGARLVGNITIGNNVKIGANAVIHKDVPDNAIAVLDPGFRIISHAGNRRANSGDAATTHG